MDEHQRPSERSRNKRDIAQPIEVKTGHAETIVADSISLAHPSDTFDFALSIAVIHHFSTRERRVSAIAELLRCLQKAKPHHVPFEAAPPASTQRCHRRSGDPEDSASHDEAPHTVDEEKGRRMGGRALIFVWALEQRSSRRGWGVGDNQDVLVPWVMQPPSVAKSVRDCDRCDGPTSTSPQDTSPPTDAQNKSSRDDGSGTEHIANQPNSENKPLTFHRYYHLYRSGELIADIENAGGRVLESGYERDNWWAVAVRSA